MSGSSTTGFQYPWSRTPESTSGWSGPRIPFTQPKFRRDSRAVLCRLRWSHCFLLLYQVINVFLFIPGHQRPLVYTRSSTSSVYTRSSTSFCLYQVINIFRLYQGIQRFLAYTRGSELFTPVAGVWWALLGPV